MTPLEYIVLGSGIAIGICCFATGYILGRGHGAQDTGRCCQLAYMQGKRDAIDESSTIKPVAK